MIGEIITGLFAGLTTGYLYARHQHQKREEEKRLEVERVTLSQEAQTKYDSGDLYWWQKYENKNLISKHKLPEQHKNLEEMLKKAREKMKEEEGAEYPAPTLSPVAKRQYKVRE